MDAHRIIKYCRILAISINLILFSSVAHAAFNYDQSLNWHTLETNHFEIHYHDDEKNIALKAAKVGEEFLNELQSTFNWVPQDKIQITISDKVDYSNGFVKPFLPTSRMTLYVNSPENGTYNDWFRILIKHELTHTLHLDKASGSSENLRNFFGNHPLLFPNAFQHMWLIEGLATYMETDYDEHTGRGQSSLYSMAMRNEVINGVRPLEQLNVSSSLWPGRSVIYLYGYYFYQFIETKYSRDHIVKLIDTYSDNLIPFNLNETFIKTFNKTLAEVWQEFEVYTVKRFMPEITRIKEQGIVKGKALTNNGYAKIYAEPIDNENLLIGEFDGKSEPELYTLNHISEVKTPLANIKSDSRIDYHDLQGILISQMENYRNTNFYYDIYQIKSDTKKMTRLTRGQRLRRAMWAPDGQYIAAIYSRLGKHSLILLEPSGKIRDILWEGSSNEVVSDIDWSPDGKYILAAVKSKSRTWNIREFSLEKKEWSNVTDNFAIENQPHYSPDGKFILYSADYDGVFNIYQLNRQDKSISKLTNVLGGAFHPKLSPAGSLTYMHNGVNGLDIYLLEQAIPLEVVDKQSLPKQLIKEYEYKDIDFTISDYNPVKQLAPQWWEPRLYLSEESQRFGVYTSGSDALLRHNYDLYTEWDFEAKAASVEFNYSYDRWFPLLQTKINSRNRLNNVYEGMLIEALIPFLSRDNRWFISTSISYEDDVSKFYDAQNVLTTSASKNRLFGAALTWDTRKNYPKTFSPYEGRAVNLIFETSAFTNSSFSGQMLTSEWREAINLKNNHGIGFRLTHGLGIDSPRPFQLGGTYSDSSLYSQSVYSSVQYRSTFYNKRRYPLRGYSPTDGKLRGRRMLLVNLEWRIPGEFIERGFPVFPLGLTKVSGTVFYNGASVWQGGLSPQKPHHGIGIEANMDTEWFTYFPARLRIGIASGLSEGGENQIYFQLGNTF